MAKNDVPIVMFESSDSMFGLLADASKHYVSARKLNIQLLARLRAKGVSFKDIEKFMMNRAREIGLWRPGIREEEITGKAWYVSLQKFLKFAKSTYSDYDTLKGIKQLKHTADPKKKTITRKTNEVVLTAPVLQNLCTEQVQMIITSNYSVLGKIAEEKGAIIEFNELMLALGMLDEIIATPATQGAAVEMTAAIQ